MLDTLLDAMTDHEKLSLEVLYNETKDRAFALVILKILKSAGELAGLVVQEFEESAMTMPSERTRSIIQAREFLVDLSRDKTLPEAVRTEARRLLRHYPTADEVLLAGKVEEQREDGLPWVFLSARID